MSFAALPGFRVFYPDQCAIRNHLFRLWRQSARQFGFFEYDAPILEPLELFTQKSGPEIVGQLFTFKDQGGRDVALRPEMTPSLARLVGSRVNSLRRPVKWFNIGEHFRYEKPQKGRMRSFYQFNADIFGEAGPGADAELIALCIHTLNAAGLSAKDFRIHLSDRTLWMHFLSGMGIEGEAAQAVLGVIDKRGRLSPEQAEAQLRPYLSDQTGSFLKQVEGLTSLRSLDALQVFFAEAPTADRDALDRRLNDWQALLADVEALGLSAYLSVDFGIVRGLSYYTGFVFEAFAVDHELRALAGGGRYDHLLSKLGYPDLPACGFAIGDVTLTHLLEATQGLPQYIDVPDLYLIIGGVDERKAALADLSLFREAGLRVDYALSPVSFGKQFKLADQSKARLAIIYGTEELARDEVKVRDMNQRNEELVPRKGLLSAIQVALK